MARVCLADEMATVCKIVRDLGLGDVEPVLLKSAHHTTLFLPSLTVVARVQSCEPLDMALRTAIREIDVARHLAKQGAPVIMPLAEKFAGPHITRSAIVTLWPYLAHEPASGQAGARLAAETLHAVHQAFRTYRGELPPYTQMLDRCWSALANVVMSPALSEEDRYFLKTQYCRLRQEVEARAGMLVPLHGDAHLGNLLLSDRGPVWTDFEAACVGPLEHDIAGLPPAAWSWFKDADQLLVERCGELKSVCVAVWCWADISRSAEIREAAEYHLQRLRGI